MRLTNPSQRKNNNMKNLLIAFTCLALTACAANPSYHKSTHQNYRPQGETNTLKLDAALVHKKNLVTDDYAVMFVINDKTHLYFQLDNGGNGSLSCTDKIGSLGSKESPSQQLCEPHNGHKLGANCTGSTTNGTLTRAQCSFTYDNEIAANFSF